MAMDRKRQLRMLGWAALLPLFILVWVLTAEPPTPAGTADRKADAAATQTEGETPEIAAQATGPNLEDREGFRTWAIENTIITELEYPQDKGDHLRIRLRKDKYSTQEAAEKVAFYLARYYKMETGFVDPVTVTILNPDSPETFYEGRF